ncbi:MAG: hypothetical protein ACE5HI_11995 [bacterium]
MVILRKILGEGWKNLFNKQHFTSNLKRFLLNDRGEVMRIFTQSGSRRMTKRNFYKFNSLVYNSWFPEFTSGLTMKIPMLIFFALLFDDLISLFGTPNYYFYLRFYRTSY